LVTIAIYIRVSTTKAEQDHGLEAQEHACRQFIESRQLAENGARLEVVLDRLSGRKPKRPGLDNLLHKAAMHHVNAVIVARLDRFTRGGIAECFRIVKELEGSGCRIHSVADPWFDPSNPAHELILASLAWAAEFESKAIGERVAAGIAARRAEADAEGNAFVWGGAHRSKLTEDPGLPSKIAERRGQGRSWSEVAEEFDIGRTTARRLCQLADGGNEPGSRSPMGPNSAPSG
jgi:DNA invertase Pin-like site-specific DNA recombinase